MLSTGTAPKSGSYVAQQPPSSTPQLDSWYVAFLESSSFYLLTSDERLGGTGAPTNESYAPPEPRAPSPAFGSFGAAPQTGAPPASHEAHMSTAGRKVRVSDAVVQSPEVVVVPEGLNLVCFSGWCQYAGDAEPVATSATARRSPSPQL